MNHPVSSLARESVKYHFLANVGPKPAPGTRSNPPPDGLDYEPKQSPEGNCV